MKNRKQNLKNNSLINENNTSMKPTKIAFTKKYFPEQYHGEDYFIEYLLEEGDTLCACFKKAKQDTFQCFKENNPQIQWNDEVIQVKENGYKMPEMEAMNNMVNSLRPSKSIDTSIPLKTFNLKEVPEEKINKGTIEEQIEACTTLDELKSWRILALSTEKLLPIYEAKYEELNRSQVK